MIPPATNSYDDIPYTTNPFAQTHPNRLATIATLLGMTPPPIERCRVLELGCAGGGNLAPMAISLPHSEFVGIDLSARQSTAGQAMVQALGLKNITIRQMDLLEVTEDFGRFDYIIAHGVYSWVPPEVQDKILSICRHNLAPTGVAYISYNTYPGWRLHSAIRDMMLFHTRHTENSRDKITQARELLDFLDESILAESTPHAKFLQSYVQYVRERFLPEGDDAYLFHNELAPINEPVYFYQFAERAAAHKLRYLAEAQFQTMLAANLPPQAVAGLRRVAKSTLELEQYMDFLRNRTFRQSLLCHQEVPLTGKVSPERLGEFYLASSALPENTKINIHSAAVDRFRAPNGDTLATDHPVTKAAMLCLSELWPQAIPFDALFAAAYARLHGRPPAAVNALDMDRQLLGANLLKGYSYNADLVEFHVYCPPFTTQISPNPAASPLARYQVENGAKTVTNLRHEMIKVEGLGGYLLPYLDGSWSRPALAKMLDSLVNEGAVELELSGSLPHDGPARQATFDDMVGAALHTLANAALLTG